MKKKTFEEERWKWETFEIVNDYKSPLAEKNLLMIWFNDLMISKYFHIKYFLLLKTHIKRKSVEMFALTQKVCPDLRIIHLKKKKQQKKTFS